MGYQAYPESTGELEVNNNMMKPGWGIMGTRKAQENQND